MSAKILVSIRALMCLAVAVVLAGCDTGKPYDYTNFRAHQPHSIVVLPPMNQSTDVKGTYSYLSTVTEPLAEMGYYVFPVEVVDQFLKENGMPGAGEMQQAPLSKFYEILGADSVLYVTLGQYGSKYKVITSSTTVEVSAKLLDTRTGTILWEGKCKAQENSSSNSILGALIAAAVTQALSSSMDRAHDVSREANYRLFTTKNHGLLYGPYNPKFGTVD